MAKVMPERKKGSWKKLPEAVRRETILKAAQRCFACKGYSDTSVNDIAVSSGLTKGGIYFHFDSKDAIRAALITEFTTTMLQAADEIKACKLSAEQQLRTLINLLVERMGEDNGLLLTITEAVSRHGTGIEEIQNYYQQIAGKVAEIILAGQANGEFSNQRNIEILVEILLTSVSGLALHRELCRAGVDVCTSKIQVVDYLLSMIKLPGV